MPEEEWEDWGDEFERPMAKGEERPVRVYFKGIESNEMVKGRIVKLAGIGVAICDESDRVVLKISKPLPSAVNCREAVEVKALIEALDALVGLGVKKIDVFVDYRALYCHITGKWIVKQRKVVNLMNRVELLKRNFTQVNVYFAPRWDVKLAFKLARDAIESQLTKNVELSGNKDVQEACTICLEDNEPSQMFAVDGCLHRFCFSCMKQHVEVKLLHGLLPSCPHEGCKIRLNVESCRKFLTPKLLGIMIQRVKEESIPVTEKIYCPYPKCSALMSLNEAIRPKMESSSKQPAYGTSGLRKCIQCNGSFCISCKVPWHERMSCSDYKRLNPQKHGEEVKLKALARQKLWRQCVKCNHMIELAEGCFHMTCRYSFLFFLF
ncbi:uncharacterized protein A4U43_C07F3830 [Asparagus officinalis]|uniref:RBR-type E3 ubiquitin transferase n=1 Tax=Asparagus officinalis TaxID=4686 RepID=A0A5P1E966_ASPOF|nr:uncharacterized protein A4U43_C07F3830 [Asparagus officinalis]